MRIEKSAPGKLIIAGEWSILEPGHHAIVMAVDRYVKVILESQDSQEITIQLPDYQIEVSGFLNQEHQLIYQMPISASVLDRLKFVQTAIETYDRFRKIDQGFKIITDSSESTYDLGDQKKKLGFGSSASVTVALISALLEAFPPTQTISDQKDLIFKLSIISHFLAQGKMGSGVDVAAATYGGIIAYQSFDREWLQEKLKANLDLSFLDEQWPFIHIQELEWPNGLQVLVGYTQVASDTRSLIRSLDELKEANSRNIIDCFNLIEQNTQLLSSAWSNQDVIKILSLLESNHQLLKSFAIQTGLDLFGNHLERLIALANEYNFIAKFSGAGGGECGLAFASSANPFTDKLISMWNEYGILFIKNKFQ